MVEPPRQGAPFADLPPEVWRRDWEFLYRGAEMLWPMLADRPDILKRREACLGFSPIPCSDIEARRFGDEVASTGNWVANRWCALFDSWAASDGTFVFDDGFAALFLLKLLWANNPVLLRGQFDARWPVRTSLERVQDRGPDFLAKAAAQGKLFINQLRELPAIRAVYSSKIPENHKTAILQHYGFPTPFLDCTYSFDVALFFAEGGAATETSRPQQDQVECGALFAFQSHVFTHPPVLVSLPPRVMRPSLQAGVFIGPIDAEDEAEIERYKLVFRHQYGPIWNGLGGIAMGSPAGMGRYLFPSSDPIEHIAAPLRRAYRAHVE